MKPCAVLWAALLAGPAALAARTAAPASVASYRSIQDAIDRNPGRMLYVPAGDYTVSEPVRITGEGSGLWGPGRIIQTNPEVEVLVAKNAPRLQLRDLTLTRAEGKKEGHKAALDVSRCPEAVIAGVQVIDNWANANAVNVSDSPRVQVRDCLIQNYSRIAIDDRTKTSFLGYAFNCIDGTGLSVKGATGALIARNRVIELRMLPTPELKAKYNLGKYVKKNAVRGWHTSPEAWASEYFNGWHQGSAIVINSGETADCIQILGNYVENAAQGIDIHGDHVIMAENIINNAFIGMKAVHGSRNVLIVGNQFSRNDLWAVNLSPGTASHTAGMAVELSGGRKSEAGANIDGESIIANNIISDFGYGMAHWNWSIESGGLAPLRLGTAGFAEQGRPPLRDVVVEGNVVYDTGRDQVLVDGKPRLEPARYKYAVKIAPGKDTPSGLHFANNLFSPGTRGVADGATPP